MHQLSVENFENISGGEVHFEAKIKLLLTDNSTLEMDTAFFGQDTCTFEGVAYPEVFSETGVLVNGFLISATHPEAGTTIYNFALNG